MSPTFKAQNWSTSQPKTQTVAPLEGALLSQKQACSYLGISGRSIYSLTKSGRLTRIRFCEKGVPKYRKVDLDAFITACVSGGDTTATKTPDKKDN